MSENEGRGSERSADKRVPEGPSSSKALPPSAPRAMSSSDTSRGPKTDSAPTRDRDWKAREVAPHLAGAPQQSQSELSASGGGSLRSRISDKEGPRSLAPAPAPANLYPPQKDDDRDSSRKRTVSDREKEASDSASGPSTEQTAQPPKRPRINRNRYPSNNYAIAKKLLPTDPQAGDKPRSGRKD